MPSLSPSLEGTQLPGWRDQWRRGASGGLRFHPPPMFVIMEASPCSQGRHGSDCCQPDCLFLQPSVPEAEGSILLRSFWHPDFRRTGHSPTRIHERCLLRPQGYESGNLSHRSHPCQHVSMKGGRELVERMGHVAKKQNTSNNDLLPLHSRTGLPFVFVFLEFQGKMNYL